MSNILEKFDLHGRTAVVTGGAGFWGGSFRWLWPRQAQMFWWQILHKALPKPTPSPARAGLRAEGIGVDVTDPNSTHGMTQAAQEIFGSLDILVNSAALDPSLTLPTPPRKVPMPLKAIA